MAKDKKKGFFSWLGFGRKNEEETQQQEQQQTQQNDVVNDVENQSTHEAAVDAATAEAERQHQAEQAAIKAAEDEAQRQYEAQQAAIDAATEQAEREREAKLAELQAAEEQAEQARQEAEEKKLAEEKAERERQEAEAMRLAEEEMARQRQVELTAIQAAEEAEEQRRQAELAAIQAAEEQAERERQTAEAARLAEEQAERERQAAEAARLAEEQAEREHQAAEEARIAEEEAEAERLRLEEEKNNLPTEQEKPKKEGFFARLKKGLLKTRQNLGSGFFGLFSGKKIDDDLFEELEEQLLIADVGVDTTRKIIDNLTAHASRKELKDAEALYGKLREEMSDILAKVDKPLVIEDKKPYVILMVGVNGVGKTTTIGKLARQYQSEGKSVMLAAGDTFRAAAVEQLQVWGERNKIPVVAQHTGADPASVIFDAIQSAQAKGVDVLIADTAGRLQNKSHLMEELKKIVRVMKKLDENAPHEIMLTLDASTGQNAVSQAKLFDDAVGLTGITLTKLDGTAKGGVIFSIADQFGIPIRYIGIGEGIEDLRPFKADDFIEALFAREE
ncbi:signal recognition particle-docking protein FtsY [Providencia hangzhouensis]|uniref:Signal recognition particle receptor FtsY n=1 Tax=Providencia rettgeri TaxID=587 RepID=A0AAJ4NH89_PRORE|nr:MULTISPECIES: signal recognition particle-docking protein FtsY [Providencia]MBJ9972109.1 signal recognition particle-docking protein FtsY [Providencia rettgeri]MCB6145381.1 signal recognition particle-docking protein FtsY [Providencia rettgeri]MCF8962939.1 Signal recognition particle receptor FtsY [Providencia rettgeri]QWQ16305.1 signal recognition particle-docking protein FtsY [Providencia rettgeri]QWQ20139.1 signal recognition particle-docking protein FtsY [Providencia rettgeri]